MRGRERERERVKHFELLIGSRWLSGQHFGVQILTQVWRFLATWIFRHLLIPHQAFTASKDCSLTSWQRGTGRVIQPLENMSTLAG